jgi:hypothetical protein
MQARQGAAINKMSGAPEAQGRAERERDSAKRQAKAAAVNDENRSAILVAGAILVVVGILLLWAFVPSAQDKTATAPLREISDEGAVQDSLQLSHLSIATSENFARQKIYVISGYLKNVGDKPLRMIELKMAFTDFDGKTILDYRQKVLDRNQKPLPPGIEFRFEVRQENLPHGWNYRVPITEVSKIGY